MEAAEKAEAQAEAIVVEAAVAAKALAGQEPKEAEEDERSALREKIERGRPSSASALARFTRAASERLGLLARRPLTPGAREGLIHSQAEM